MMKTSTRQRLGLALAGTLVAMLSFAPASAEDTLEKLRKQGFATVAVANEPPYSDIKSDGYVTGAAPEVARAVMKKLGVPELKAQVVPYGSMIPALLARRVDMATSGLYIKPDRCEAIIYSEPDLCGAEAFAVAKGNPHNLHTYEDIAANPDVTMTTCAGCAEELYATERGVQGGRSRFSPIRRAASRCCSRAASMSSRCRASAPRTC
jgi:polar amino acid transport system substrate-binding protein